MASAEPFWLIGVRWRLFWAALTALPLLWPAVPPLADLPGHLARLRIAMADSGSPLEAYYAFHWRLMGNLGLDLLVPPLARIVGLEPAVKFVILIIPVLTAWGMMAIAREIHGRFPATILFALPFALGWPFLFGFANYALSMAMALNAFALWIRLGRTGRAKLRRAVFVPIGIVVWLTHGFGWGALGLFVFAYEFASHPARNFGKRTVEAISLCVPLFPPLLLTLLWQGNGGGSFTGYWFDFGRKAQWLVMSLRDRWRWLDLGSVFLIFGVFLHRMRSTHSTFSRPILAIAATLLAAYLLLPWVLFSSAYADMRLAPFILAMAVIALAPIDFSGRAGKALALLAVAFFLVRIGVTTASFIMTAQRQERAMAVLNHVPRGARLVSFVVTECGEHWHDKALDHLPDMAVVRREAFSNGLWSNPGAPLVSIRKSDAHPFDTEPSQLVTPDGCVIDTFKPLRRALRELPRSAFDYLWLIDLPEGTQVPDAAGRLILVWSNGTDSLFRILHDQRPAEAAATIAL